MVPGVHSKRLLSDDVKNFKFNPNSNASRVTYARMSSALVKDPAASIIDVCWYLMYMILIDNELRHVFSDEMTDKVLVAFFPEILILASTFPHPEFSNKNA